MKRYLAGSLVLALAFTAACGKKKVEDKAENTGSATKTDETKTGDAEAEKPVEKLTTTYPPVFDVYPQSLPAPGRSLYFGVSPGTAGANYDMIWIWIVAALPDFEGALQPPVFNTQAEYDAFMDKWAAEFAALPAQVAALDKIATDFKFTIDPVYFTDTAYAIPANVTAALPQYVRTTQKIFARRYRTVAAGNTSISGTFQGATLTIPAVVTAYTAAQYNAGKTRYAVAGTAPTSGCVDCHGVANNTNDAFVKHSSDYLAYATDVEILNIVKLATYPDGSKLNNGTHLMTFADAAADTAIVSYLRSLPSSVDKIFGAQADPAALRLTGKKTQPFFRTKNP